MSQTTSEPGESPNSLPCLDVEPGKPRPALLHLCDRVVTWVANFDMMTNRIHWVEANGGSEAEVDAAMEQEVKVLLEIDGFAATLADMHAANQIEIEGKQRALNALTGLPTWERDSLFDLWCSIERDQLEVNAVLVASSQPPAQRTDWLSRFNTPIAKG
jgi:hypothetical protein